MSDTENWERLIELLFAKESFETVESKPGKILRIRSTMWGRLEKEGRYSLISKLKAVERKEAGYGTIVVPDKGFSEDPVTHDMVIKWLIERQVNIINPKKLIKGLEDAFT